MSVCELRTTVVKMTITVLELRITVVKMTITPVAEILRVVDVRRLAKDDVSKVFFV